MTLSQVSSVVSLTWNALVAGNGSYILAAYGHDLDGPTILKSKTVLDFLIRYISSI